MRFPAIFVMFAVVAFVCCGCLSKYDPISEQHADQNAEGLRLDLNNGLAGDDVERTIGLAFDEVVPPAAGGDEGAVAARDELYGRFREILGDLILAQISVDIAIERGQAWVRYEQSKRDPEPEDLPRLEPLPDDE